MAYKIALAGNPNCGKTTMYNELTGSSQYVGNWPGVTVEKKEGRLKNYKDVYLTDLPGIYSLSPYSPEELVSRDYIINGKIDAIINIIDGSNLERNLYLTLMLIETGIPVIAAMNMIDVVNKKGDFIDIKALSEKLGCDIIETSALKGTGLKELAEKAANLAKQKKQYGQYMAFPPATETALEKIGGLICGRVNGNARWFAIKAFERDKNVYGELKLPPGIILQIEGIIKDCEKLSGDDSESIIIKERYEYITKILEGIYVKKSSGESRTDKIDKILTNRFLAIPIFFIIMWGIYFLSIQFLGGITTEYISMFFSDILGKNTALWLEKINAAPWLSGLFTEGIINGVGSVLVFIPQLMMLFFFLSLLEDCGYMSRVAFIMDRIFKNFGLSGKSFIPMLIGTGCSVPAIMAARTIENDKDRKMTIMLTPFIPCGAKLPVFSLIAGAVFPYSSIVAPSMYFAGIITVILCGIILKRLKYFKGKPAPFVMELPDYQLPKLKNVFRQIWERSRAFIVKAGTVIFLASGILWLLQSFNWSFQTVSAENSILSFIGRFIAPVFAPLGFGNWEISVATLSGYLAKENIVAAMQIVSGLGSGANENGAAFTAAVASLFENQYAAYSFMIFTLLAPPCFAALSTIKREMGSVKWLLAAILFQFAAAYTASFLVYQFSSMVFSGGTPLTTFFIASVLILIAVLIIYRKIKYRKQKCRAGCGGNCGNCRLK